MNMDWALAMAVFIVFASWSLIYYSGFFESNNDISDTMSGITESIIEYLEADEYTMPVRYNSGNSGTAVLFAEDAIPEDMRDGAGVFSGGTLLDCMIYGDRIYWETGISEGDNIFEIKYSGESTGWCSGTIDTSDANQTYPLAAVKSRNIPAGRLEGLKNVAYQNFTQMIGIQNNVRIEWTGDAKGIYGPEPPGNRDVFVREINIPLLGGTGSVTLRILAWE